MEKCEICKKEIEKLKVEDVVDGSTICIPCFEQVKNEHSRQESPTPPA